MQRKLLSLPSVLSSSVRGRHVWSFKYPDGKEYEGVTYYPRDPNKEEEPIKNPAKLFRVERIRTLKGSPHHEKRIMVRLGIADEQGRGPRVTIVKNIPEINKQLWKVKHLVRIDPITFPHGEPTENDINHTRLSATGECRVTKEIAIDPARIEAVDKFIKDPTRLDKDTLQRDALMKWINPYI